MRRMTKPARRRDRSSAQWRWWDAGLAVHLRDEHCEVVDETPRPLLARFEGADQRMALRLRVSARVTIWRVIAAADLSTLETDSEVEPRIPNLQTLLAPLDRVGKLRDLDLVEMSTGGHSTPPLEEGGIFSWRISAR